MDDDEYQVKLRSRALGAGILLVGIVLVGVNVAFLTSAERFYPKLLVVGCAAIPAGMFGTAFGWSPQFRGEPLWWQAGAWASSGWVSSQASAPCGSSRPELPRGQALAATDSAAPVEG